MKLVIILHLRCLYVMLKCSLFNYGNIMSTHEFLLDYVIGQNVQLLILNL